MHTLKPGSVYLPVHAANASEPAAPQPAVELSAEDAQYLVRFTKLKEILSGELPTALHLEFLYSANKADLQVLRNIKAATEVRGRVPDMLWHVYS